MRNRLLKTIPSISRKIKIVRNVSNKKIAGINGERKIKEQVLSVTDGNNKRSSQHHRHDTTRE